MRVVAVALRVALVACLVFVPWRVFTLRDRNSVPDCFFHAVFGTQVPEATCTKHTDCPTGARCKQSECSFSCETSDTTWDLTWAFVTSLFRAGDAACRNNYECVNGTCEDPKKEKTANRGQSMECRQVLWDASCDVGMVVAFFVLLFCAVFTPAVFYPQAKRDRRQPRMQTSDTLSGKNIPSGSWSVSYAGVSSVGAHALGLAKIGSNFRSWLFSSLYRAGLSSRNAHCDLECDLHPALCRRDIVSLLDRWVSFSREELVREQRDFLSRFWRSLCLDQHQDQHDLVVTFASLEAEGDAEGVFYGLWHVISSSSGVNPEGDPEVPIRTIVRELPASDVGDLRSKYSELVKRIERGECNRDDIHATFDEIKEVVKDIWIAVGWKDVEEMILQQKTRAASAGDAPPKIAFDLGPFFESLLLWPLISMSNGPEPIYWRLLPPVVCNGDHFPPDEENQTNNTTEAEARYRRAAVDDSTQRFFTQDDFPNVESLSWDELCQTEPGSLSSIIFLGHGTPPTPSKGAGLCVAGRQGVVYADAFLDIPAIIRGTHVRFDSCFVASTPGVYGERSQSIVSTLFSLGARSVLAPTLMVSWRSKFVVSFERAIQNDVDPNDPWAASRKFCELQAEELSKFIKEAHREARFEDVQAGFLTLSFRFMTW